VHAHIVLPESGTETGIALVISVLNISQTHIHAHTHTHSVLPESGTETGIALVISVLNISLKQFVRLLACESEALMNSPIKTLKSDGLMPWFGVAVKVQIRAYSI
jgi:hypothetical protein